MSFLSELKRRKVFRAGGAYLIAVWVALQVIDLVGPAIGMPDWVLTASILISVVGLPIVLALSWGYDLTSEGVVRSEESVVGELAARPTGITRWIELSIFVLLLAAVAYLLIDKLFLAAKELPILPDGRRSIAVLPFANLSADPEQQYFADGIAEEILNALAAVQDLRVTSRTSSFAIRDSGLSTREIAEQLDVDYVVEGSVRKSEATARVTVQLIQAESDAHLWSENFDIDLAVSEILHVQETVARSISDRLKVRVLPSDEIRERPPANLAALDTFLDGNSYLRRIETQNGGPDEVYRAAIERFEQSIEADPDWAPSRHALGATYHFWLNETDFEERWQKSFDQIQEALRLDPNYQPAYVSLGFLHMTKRNFIDSLAAYEKVDASTRNAFWGKAILMAELSRYDEAAAHYRAARSLDPLSANIRLQDAANLVCAGRYADAVLAIESARVDLQATENRIDWVLPDLAYAYAKSDRPESANQIVDDWIDMTEFYPPIAPVLALVGRREEAAAILEAIDERNEYFPAAYSAVSVLLGDDDRALDYLEKIAKEAPSALFRFHCFEETRQLARYSRYTRLLAELGFPENYR